jgi:hypothetical protein
MCVAASLWTGNIFSGYIAFGILSARMRINTETLMSPEEFLAGVHTHLKDFAPQFYEVHVKDVDFSTYTPTQGDFGAGVHPEIVCPVISESLRKIYALAEFLIQYYQLNVQKERSESETCIALNTTGHLCMLMFWEYVLTTFPERRNRYVFYIDPNWDVYAIPAEKKDLEGPKVGSVPRRIMVGIKGVLLVNFLYKEARKYV